MRCHVLVVSCAAAVAIGCGSVTQSGTARLDAPAPASAYEPCDRGRHVPKNALRGRWRQRSIAIGSAIFLELRRAARAPGWRFEVASEQARHLPEEDARELLDQGADTYDAYAVKVLLAPDRRVRIEVDEPRRATLFPTFKPAFGGYSLADGVAAMRCRSEPPFARRAVGPVETTWTLVDLAFIVAGPQCLRVRVEDDAGGVALRRIRFGRGARCDD